MVTQIDILVSFLLLLGISAYCLVNHYTNKGIGNGETLTVEFPFLTYFFIALYALCGTVVYCRDVANHMLWKWLYDTEIFTKTLSYPCFVTEIWLRYGVIQPEIAWVHAIIGAIPAVLFVLDSRLKKNWIDLLVFLNTLSLSIVCLQNVNKWGLLAATTFTTGYYIHRYRLHLLDKGSDIWFNCFLAAFCACCFKTLNP